MTLSSLDKNILGNLFFMIFSQLIELSDSR